MTTRRRKRQSPAQIVQKLRDADAMLNGHLINIVPLQAAATETDDSFYYRSSEATFNNGGVSRNGGPSMPGSREAPAEH